MCDFPQRPQISLSVSNFPHLEKYFPFSFPFLQNHLVGTIYLYQQTMTLTDICILILHGLGSVLFCYSRMGWGGVAMTTYTYVIT